ncbi:MAG: 50S ribosomal protein L9 [Rickettsiales bacterium]|nr:50S ribosomal protein L9 [Rickettsiales bacterium]|tara:strand:+ start:817 stop:1449 length:633 start_codon:yes stop_codon:yes gene_type:complete
MKLILISTVANLGKIGDVVQVKDGFARNFLIPNKKAVIYNENNFKIFENKKKHFEEESQKLIKIANSVKKSIGAINVVITENASDDGRLYGSINSSIIAEKINKIVKDNHLSKTNIILQNQIKEIGVYKVTISLHPDAQFDITLVVCRNESEVDALIKAKKEAEKKSQLPENGTEKSLDKITSKKNNKENSEDQKDDPASTSQNNIDQNS